MQFCVFLAIGNSGILFQGGCHCKCNVIYTLLKRQQRETSAIWCRNFPVLKTTLLYYGKNYVWLQHMKPISLKKSDQKLLRHDDQQQKNTWNLVTNRCHFFTENTPRRQKYISKYLVKNFTYFVTKNKKMMKLLSFREWTIYICCQNPENCWGFL